VRLKGIVQSAVLEENPPGSDLIEMILRVQGVGAGQPRKIVLPYELLLCEATLDPENVEGHSFEAEVELGADARWLVSQIAFAQKRILRDKEP
jgi:hypothetical protein